MDFEAQSTFPVDDDQQLPNALHWNSAAETATIFTSPVLYPPFDYPALQLGSHNFTVEDIKSQWIRYNHCQTPQKNVIAMVSDAKKGLWKSICGCVRGINTIKDWKENTICKAHIFLSKSTVKSIDLNHSCTEEHAGRKRNYNAKQLHLASNELLKTIPNTSKRSRRSEAAQEYIEAAEKDGFVVGKTQAYKVVSRMTRQPIEAQIGEFFLLTSVLEAWKRADPDGSYVLEKSPCSWKRQQPRTEQFQRCYIAPSMSKHAWKHSKVRLVISDACDTSSSWSSFHMSMLIAATFDGNNQVVVLAFALCDEDTELNWFWFVQNLMRDFSNISVFLSSSEHVAEGNHIPNLLKLLNTTPSRCINSLIGSVEENLSLELTTTEKEQIYRVARCTSAQAYHQEIRRFSNSIATFLDARKDLFVAHWLLQSTCSQSSSTTKDKRQRFGVIASPVGDLLQTQVLEIIDQPVVTMTTSLLMKLCESHSERKVQALGWLNNGTLLTDYARECFGKILQESRAWNVQISGHNGNLWRGVVSQHRNEEITGSTFAVAVNIELFQMDCPCRVSEEMGFPCVHATSLLMSQNLMAGIDTRWFHPRYHVTTLLEMYDFDPPDFSVFGKLSVDELIPPEDCQATTTQKRRKTTTGYNSVGAAIFTNTTGGNLHKCSACGQRGHHPKTCHQPSTKYRYTQFHDKAMDWAKTTLELPNIGM